jgi:hypothetical protein
MARWYASREGRFMSPDPGNAGVDLVSPQTWNLYVYVSNDPINQIDPTGLCRKAVIRVTSYAGEDGSFGPAVPDDPSDLDLSEECGFLSQLFGGFLDNAIGIGGLFGLGQLFGGETSTLGLTEGAASAPARIPRRPMEKFQETAPSNQSGIVSSADEYLLHRPWVVSWIVPIKPVPFIAGFGPAGSFAWNPNTHTACIGIGGGASAGKNVSYGPLTHGYMWDGRKWPDGADDVLSGVALSGGFNFPWLVGGQGTIGFSGAAMGPSLGVPGGALSITYSHCMGF